MCGLQLLAENALYRCSWATVALLECNAHQIQGWSVRQYIPVNRLHSNTHSYNNWPGACHGAERQRVSSLISPEHDRGCW